MAVIELSVEDISIPSAERNKFSEFTTTFPDKKYLSSTMLLSSASISRLVVLSEKASIGIIDWYSGQRSHRFWSSAQLRLTPLALAEKWLKITIRKIMYLLIGDGVLFLY